MTILASHERSIKYLYPNVPIPSTIGMYESELYEFMAPVDSKLVL